MQPKTTKKKSRKERQFELSPIFEPHLVKTRDAICEINFFQNNNDENCYEQGKILAHCGFTEEDANYPAGTREAKLRSFGFNEYKKQKKLPFASASATK